MPTSYNFTGQRLDSETGLLYYGARYYDPMSGRFTQADLVLNNAEGMDPYAYVGENPESRTDPTGEMYAPPHPGAGSPPPSPNTDTPSAPPSTPWWQQTWNVTTQVFQSAIQFGNTVSTLQLKAADFFFGISSMGNDLRTLFNGDTSVGDKIWGGLDLAFNAGTDIAMFFGVGELIRVGDLALKGGDLALKAGEDLLEHGGEEAISHFGETLLDDGESLLGDFCSFTASTAVMTATGKQAIGKLHTGEKVLAYNPKTHKMELEPILHVWIDKDSDLVDLTLTTVKAQHGRSVSRQSEVIHTNKKHPFFTKERGFLPVGQIKLGMHVLRADGTHGVVTGWRVVPGTQVMYNLEVAQDHTFTVGSGEWVVHNSCIVQDARSSNTFNDAMRQEVQPTLDRIEQGISDPHPNDGTPFANRDGDLPAQSPNYYTEFVHHPSGVINIPGDISRGPAGAQRIIIGNEGEVYYAPYHYRFVIYRLY